MHVHVHAHTQSLSKDWAVTCFSKCSTVGSDSVVVLEIDLGLKITF